MTEGEFIRFYKKRNLSKNYREVKEKIDLFWKALLEALDKEGRVSLKNWGTFEVKEVKPRKIMIPNIGKMAFTEEKKKIKFTSGAGLRNIVNRADTDE